jgi:hypothetical protein
MTSDKQGSCLLLNWRLRLQTSGIYRFIAIPGPYGSAGRRNDLRPPGLAPGSALRLRPRRALSSAPANSTVEKNAVLEKLVVVADREK